MNFISSSPFARAYLGKHAHDLMLKTSDQMGQVYEQRGIAVPMVASSVAHFLAENDRASLSDVARGLDIPHQLAAQRVQKLLDLGLVNKQHDPADARKSAYSLTVAGRHQANLLAECMAGTVEVYEDIYAEIGCDLAAALVEGMKCIERKTLAERFAEKFESVSAA